MQTNDDVLREKRKKDTTHKARSGLNVILTEKYLLSFFGCFLVHFRFAYQLDDPNSEALVAKNLRCVNVSKNLHEIIIHDSSSII